MRFVSPTRAEVSWLADGAGAGAVEIGKTEELGSKIAAKRTNRSLTAELADLEHQTVYFYQIAHGDRKSPVYQLNTALNFSQPRFDSNPATHPALKSSGIRKGFLVLLGADADLAADLAAQSEMTVTAFDSDQNAVNQARRKLYQQGIYGSRTTVTHVDSDRLPLTSGMADLVVCQDWRDAFDAAEIARILAPGRGTAWLKNAPSRELRDTGLETSRDGDWTLAKRPKSPETGAWTHQYGDAGNTATSGESLGGAKSTQDLAVRWFGRPGADFGLDRQSRMPAPLAANGRLFHQGMNRLIALNAHNGSVLWSLEMPEFQRLNMPRDASNWCLDDRRLYVAVQERAWILDAETGDLEATLPPVFEGGDRDWGYIGRAGDFLVGSATKPKSAYTGYWSNRMWFDGKGGSYGTAQVCSDSIFAYHVGKPNLAWHYQNGVILNPTIALQKDRVIFVESRNSQVKSNRTSQISAPELWRDQFLVALDLESGEVLWERQIDTEDGTVTFYLQATPNTILITASNTAYHLYAFDLKAGQPRWNRSNPWPNDHHSGHIQHPVILDETIYLQPNGYDLRSGEIRTTNVGSRSGCHTYVGAKNALIYRGAGRQVAMWDRQAETVSAWNRLRPSCWLSFVPANGMLLVPEGGGGCSCGGWMETSIGFGPKGNANGEIQTPP